MGEPGAKVALVAGASGLSGHHLLGMLLEAPDFTRVYAVTRRPLAREHPRLANRIAQFDRLEAQLRGVTCHTAFCCLGAPRHRAAVDEAHRRVELEYVLAFARAAKAARAERFVLLSCVDAASAARRPYASLKREAERALEALGFPSLNILQPGPLLGIRREMQWIDLVEMLVALLTLFFARGAREPRRALSARTVAAAMLGAARSGRRGVYRYTYSGIRALARAKFRGGTTRTDVATPKARPPPL